MSEVRLSVSNICWPDGQGAHEEAIDALVGLDVPAIDIAPTKAWPHFAKEGAGSADVTDEDIADFVRTLKGRTVAGFQSLTFGVTGEIFTRDGKEGDAGREALVKRVRDTVDLAQRVGATTLVYGSPKTRILPEGLSGLGLAMRGQEFFAPLAAYADQKGIILGIEPVSRTYVDPGFGQSGEDVDYFVNTFNDPDAAWGRPALVPDTFAMHDGDFDPVGVINRASLGYRLAPHWQISEPGMRPVGEGESPIDHALFAATLGVIATRGGSHLLYSPELRRHDIYDGPITVAIEMLPHPDMPVEQSLTQAVNFARENYPLLNR